MSDEVLCRIAGGVATVTLNRPDRLNSMDKALTLRLLETLDRVAADPQVRAVVLTGAGRAFSAGGDRFENIADSIVATGPEADMAGRLRDAMRSAEVLCGMPKIAIAAVNGACVGAALALACSCDIRIASTAARFGTGFVLAALSGDFGGTWTLPRVVGDAAARDLYLLGELIDAREAHRIGLVSRCVEAADFDRAVADLAERAAALPSTAVRLIKANLNEASSGTLADAMEREAARTVQCLNSADAGQARADFRDRHQPR